MRLATDECWDRMAAAEHGVLCTTNATGAIDAVPTCLAVVGSRIATPIDTVKPKTTTALGRRANLERDPGGTLLCEHWDAGDWSRLWWVRARLVYVPTPSSTSMSMSTPVDDVDEYEAALRAKYVHYRTVDFAAVLVFDVTDVTGWSAAD